MKTMASRPIQWKPASSPREVRTADRERRKPEVRQRLTARAERDYARHLSRLASNVGKIVSQVQSQGVIPLLTALHQYAEAIAPWAEKVAATMIRQVDERDRSAWRALGEEISTQLHKELREAPVGARVQELLAQQVDLIKSIPRQAAERVHQLSIEALAGGGRAKEVAEEIARTNQVTKSRAMLIARTETARASTVLTQARAESVGSTHYIWRTAGDSDVRKGHKAMEGKVCEWANPPAVNENGRIMHFHPGSVWNCRCYPESIVPDPYAPSVRGRRR